MNVDKQIEAITRGLHGRRGVVIIGHMGLGDQLVSYGLVDTIARKHSTVVLCCNRNHAGALSRMYGVEHSNDVILLLLASDADIVPGFGADPERVKRLERAGLRVLYTYYIDPNTKAIDFDLKTTAFWKRVYENAGVPEGACLDSFRRMIRGIKRSVKAVPIPKGPYVVIHEDMSRGMLLNRKFLPTNVHVVNVHGTNDDIFDYIDLIVNASEYHGFDSSFAWLVHLGGLRTHTRKVFHAYVKGINDTRVLYPRDPSGTPWIDVWS